MKILLTRLYDTQKVLDKRYAEIHGFDPMDWNIFQKRVVALLVEMGECMNEYRGFKFWSKDQAPRPKLLEEYIDGFHFILSLGITIDETEHIPSFPGPAYIDGISKEGLFIILVQLAAGMSEDNYYEQLLQTYIDFGYALGFTWEDIQNEYMRKNNINHSRQDAGY